jgi:hypothetical protein
VYFRRAVFSMRTRADFDALMAGYREWRRQFLDERGDLLPRYAPEPQCSSLLEPDGAARNEGEAIAVPKGPIAIW